jgi:hypothetical protein
MKGKPNAKLTAEQVREIRASNEPLKVLAHRYGVTAAAISAVRTEKSWKDVA